MHVKRNAMSHVEIAQKLPRTLLFHVGILLRSNVEISNKLSPWNVPFLLPDNYLVATRLRHHVPS